MKKILLILLILSTSLFAKGHYCSALCLSVDSYQQTIDILGEIEIEVGTQSAREAHRYLKKKCRNSYYDRSGILVDNLSFKSTYDSSSSSHDYYGEYFYSDGWTLYSGYEMGGSYSSSEHQTLDISIIRSKADKACEFDITIPKGYLPYLGNIPVL